jgi:hypothetical protein
MGAMFTPETGANPKRHRNLETIVALWATPHTAPGGSLGEPLEKWEQRAARKAAENIHLHRPLHIQIQQWATPTTRDWKDGASPSDAAPTNGLLGRQAPRSGIVGPSSSQSGQSLPPQQWPTPSVPNGGRQPKFGMSRTGMTPDGKKRQVGLHNVAEQMWQTPRTGAHGTPGADATHGGQPKRLRLNPLFVEWLMGLPIGWTDLKPLATQSSLPAPRTLGQR